MGDEWKANPPQGYWLEFDEKLQTEPRHEFCGEQEIPGAECPACLKPLLRLASLDTRDPVLQFANSVPFLHLLYCWTCSIPYGPLNYRLGTDGSVAVLSHRKDSADAFGPEGPYDDYPGWFPKHLVSLKPLTDLEQGMIMERQQQEDFELPEEYSYLDDTRHQIGGHPLIYNPQSPVDCPVCSVEAPFLAAISDNAGGNGFPEGYVSFTGNLGVQMIFHFCRKCSVVSAYHSVD